MKKFVIPVAGITVLTSIVVIVISWIQKNKKEINKGGRI